VCGEKRKMEKKDGGAGLMPATSIFLEGGGEKEK
jgi:hypothetical protein